jgi:aerobic-type carbon monoxide dehydrogenase small subunit (CoxS/CutS family)
MAPAGPETGVARGPGAVDLTLNVNGVERRLRVEPRTTLLDALRDQLGLTGAKRVCDCGECGACTLLIDGRAVYGCMTLAIECEGREILTIEGLAEGDRLHPVQQAFLDADGCQCGFCTSGQILATKALLDRNPEPSAEEIRRGVSGNLCRCGAYLKIFRAVELATVSLRGQRR